MTKKKRLRKAQEFHAISHKGWQWDEKLQCQRCKKSKREMTPKHIKKKCIRYWWIFVDIFIKRNFKTDGDMGGLWNSLTVVRMPKLSINQRDADIYHISMCWSASFRKPQFVTHRWGEVVRFEILDKDRIIYIPSNAWLALLFLISI